MAGYANLSSSGRGSDDPMRSDDANLRMTPKISCRSPQLVFKKPCLEFGVLQATNFVSVCQKNSPSSVENFGARQAKKIIGLVPGLRPDVLRELALIRAVAVRCSRCRLASFAEKRAKNERPLCGEKGETTRPWE